MKINRKTRNTNGRKPRRGQMNKNLLTVLALLAIAGCGLAGTEEGLDTDGTGGTGGNNGGTGGNTGGTGGNVGGTGGNTNTGGTGGTSNSSGPCGQYGTDWVIRLDGARAKISPVWLSCHPAARLRVYQGHVEVSPAIANNAAQTWVASATTDGYLFDFAGKAIGDYHFSYGRPLPFDDWAQYGAADIIDRLVIDSKRCLERSGNGYGLWVYYDGTRLQCRNNLGF